MQIEGATDVNLPRHCFTFLLKSTKNFTLSV